MRTLSVATLAVAVALLTGGCRTTPSTCVGAGSDEEVPSWVSGSLPQSATAVFAVASWPPTRFEQDALEKAKANARAELAKTIRVKVQGVLVDWQSSARSLTTGQAHSEDYISLLSKETLNVAMSGSQILQIWVDRAGQASQAGTVWALAKLDKSNLGEELLKAAREARSGLAPEDQAALDEHGVKIYDDLEKRLERIE